MLRDKFGDKMVPVWGHGDKGAILGTVPDFWGQLAPMQTVDKQKPTCDVLLI